MNKSPEGVPASSNASDEEKITATGIHRKQLFLRCCGCATALVVIIAILIVVLILTVFKAREPIFRIYNATVEKIELINGTNTPRPGSNVTINADVSLKNRNFISFEHSSTTSAIYYHGVVIGEVFAPPATERARRTMRMNVTGAIITDRIVSQPDLGSDIKSGLITMSSYTRAGGKAKVWIFKKHVMVKMNCTATINITSLVIQQQECKQKFKF